MHPTARLADGTHVHVLYIPVGPLDKLHTIVGGKVATYMAPLNNADLVDFRLVQVIDQYAVVELRTREKASASSVDAATEPS
jgi:hypothetical protein